MPERSDFEPGGAPGAGDRAGILASVGAYVLEWQQLIEAGARPTAQQEARLNQRAAELQRSAAAVGFGGLAFHIAEYVRLLTQGAPLPNVRGQLSIVAELAAQARQTLTPEENARMTANSRDSRESSAAPSSLAPPPMITIARPMNREVAAALQSAQMPPAAAPARVAPPVAPPPVVALPQMPAAVARPAPPAPAAPAPPPAVALPAVPPMTALPAVPSPALPGRMPAPIAPPPAPPDRWSGQPAAPLPPNPPAAPPGPQFGVKSMLNLRAFGKPVTGNRPAVAEPSRSPAHGSSGPLGLPGFGPKTSTRDSRSSKPPPFLANDPSGLPPLAPEASRDSAAARQSSDILDRLRHDRGSARPADRSRTPARGSSAKSVVRRPGLRGRPDAGSGRTGLWVGLGSAAVLVSIGLVAFFTLGRPKPPPAVPTDPAKGTTKTATNADATSADTAKPAKQGVEIPREKLLADDERFTALLAQVHGHGGKETPELRSLLNDQAALASKALSGNCKDGSARCKAWAEVKDVMVGDRKPIVRHVRDSNSDSTLSRWMAGLKMPGIPVQDDPRVQRVFEFYTENPVGRETFQSMLFRCGAYRDLIQSTLIRYDLPPDLMALAFTESGCEPSAKSPVGAAGLWQFMPETARAYHLRVIEGTIDERYSPFKSTEASIRMLADLREKLGSWDLVFASYNLGPFGVLARLERAGPDASFWDLVDAGLLPDETANYSPTVEAIALILANLQRLKFAGVQIGAPQPTADLEVPGGTRLGLVARAAATSVTRLRSLNLDFSGDVVPVVPGGAIAVQVPKEVVWQARDTIKELLSSKDGSDQCVPPTFDWGKQRFTTEMNAVCQRRLQTLQAAPSGAP